MASVTRMLCCASTWLAFQLATAGCLDDAEFSPVRELSVLGDEVAKLRPGESSQITVQALDAQGRGQNGAEVTFVVSDTTRLELSGSEGGVNQLTVLTALQRSASISADGLAAISVHALDSAAEGEAIIVAVVKQPTDSTAAIATRIAVQVTAPSDADAGAKP